MGIVLCQIRDKMVRTKSIVLAFNDCESDQKTWPLVCTFRMIHTYSSFCIRVSVTVTVPTKQMEVVGKGHCWLHAYSVGCLFQRISDVQDPWSLGFSTRHLQCIIEQPSPSNHCHRLSTSLTHHCLQQNLISNPSCWAALRKCQYTDSADAH